MQKIDTTTTAGGRNGVRPSIRVVGRPSSSWMVVGSTIGAIRVDTEGAGGLLAADRVRAAAPDKDDEDEDDGDGDGDQGRCPGKA